MADRPANEAPHARFYAQPDGPAVTIAPTDRFISFFMLCPSQGAQQVHLLGIKKIRDQISSKSDSWTAPELLKVPASD